MFSELTPVLKALLMLREHPDDICLDVIEKFGILSYNRPSSLCKVNEVKQELLSGRQDPLREFLVLKNPYCVLKELSSSDFV